MINAQAIKKATDPILFSPSGRRDCGNDDVVWVTENSSRGKKWRCWDDTSLVIKNLSRLSNSYLLERKAIKMIKIHWWILCEYAVQGF